MTGARGAWLLCVMLLVGCATTPARHASEPAHLQDIVRRYHAALNTRDLLLLTAYVTADVEWYSVIDGERVLEVSGREALAQSLRTFFAAHDRTHWSFDIATAHGNVIAVRERSQWRSVGDSAERSGICVYELHDGRIRRITQYLQH